MRAAISGLMRLPVTRPPRPPSRATFAPRRAACRVADLHVTRAVHRETHQALESKAQSRPSASKSAADEVCRVSIHIAPFGCSRESYWRICLLARSSRASPRTVDPKEHVALDGAEPVDLSHQPSSALMASRAMRRPRAPAARLAFELDQVRLQRVAGEAQLGSRLVVPDASSSSTSRAISRASGCAEPSRRRWAMTASITASGSSSTRPCPGAIARGA